MESVTNLLTPDQVDAILAVYDTVASWYAQAVNFISVTTESIVIEDIWL